MYPVDPDDDDYKDIILNAKRKLEIPTAATMACKRAFSQASVRESGVSKTGKAKKSEVKTRFSCIAEARESTRQRIESVTKRIHEEHIAGKGENLALHYNLAQKFISMHQAMKIPDAKAAVDKEWKKLETLPAWRLEKVKSKKGGRKGGTEKQQQSSLCIIDGLMPPEEFGVGTTMPDVQRKGCASSRHCERRLWSLCSIY